MAAQRHSEKFVTDILKLLKGGSSNDVRIKLSDGEILANKDVLIVRSDYFATMLHDNKFVEGETNTVDMSHCSKLVMEKIVTYLFSGEISYNELTLAQLLELLNMSDMLLLTEVVDQLERYITGDIIRCSKVEFLPELISGLMIADQYNLSTVTEHLIKSISSALKDIPRIPEDAQNSFSFTFRTLPFNIVKKILLDHPPRRSIIFVGYGYDNPTTKHRFDAFVFWLSKNEISDEEKKEIVDSFNFEDFTVEELLTYVRDSGFYAVKRIDKRVLELVTRKEEEIVKLKKMINEAKYFIPFNKIHRFNY